MTPSDSPFNQPDADLPGPSQPTDVHGRWTLTREALDKLLNSFSEDRDEAGRQYELTRRKLVRFFEWRATGAAEEHADETINRVARRIDQGENVYNLTGYFYAVARLVFMEVSRDNAKATVGLENVNLYTNDQLGADDESDPRLRCFDKCLSQLPPDNRTLILTYYQEERRAKIDLRKELSRKLDIPLNALRIRAHRIRASLEKCITECLVQNA